MRKLKQEKLRRRISYELHLQAIKVNRGVLYFAQYKKKCTRLRRNDAK